MTTRYPSREAGDTPYMVHAMQLVHTYADSLLPFANYLPEDAQILCAIVKITAAYNAGTTNVLTIGQNSTSYNDIAAAGDIDEATTGADIVWTGAALDLSSAPVLPYVKYAQTGTAATAGRSIITLLYIPKIDR
jgi:hypothetical protein